MHFSRRIYALSERYVRKNEPGFKNSAELDAVVSRASRLIAQSESAQTGKHRNDLKRRDEENETRETKSDELNNSIVTGRRHESILLPP